MNRRLLFAILLLWSISRVYSQDYKKISIRKKSGQESIQSLYHYRSDDHLNFRKLTLYKNHTYLLTYFGHAGNFHSRGNWEQLKEKIILRNEFKKDDLPIRLVYKENNFDTAFSNLKIEVVKNAEDKPLPDVVVCVNEDSVECLPLMGKCIGSFNGIDSIKIKVGNGLTSKWIKVTHHTYNAILPVILMNDDPASYLAFDEKCFMITKNILREIGQEE